MEFFETVMGRAFYDGTMPKIANALVRIADRLGALEQIAQPDSDDEPGIDELLLALKRRVDKRWRAVKEVQGVDEANRWLAFFHGQLHEEVGAPVEGAKEAVKLLAGRRGLKRAAYLARSFEALDAGVPLPMQREVLKAFAAFLEAHVDSAGDPATGEI